MEFDGNDLILIGDIADRIVKLENLKGKKAREVSSHCKTMLMVVHVCHGLNLERLAGFADHNLAHDVYGIREHVNHEGQLDGRFAPRCGTER
jgi:hypothetical protein